MVKILIVIMSLLLIIKINQWAEKQKWEKFRNFPKDKSTVEQVCYAPNLYYAYNTNK